MKTFEEKWTAWLDDELTANERAEFEASLPNREAAETEKLEAHKLGVLLREQLQARPMGNEEFFHHQLRQRIAAEDAIDAPIPETRPKPVLWPIGRLVWAGALSLVIFGLVTFAIMREKTPTDQSQYLTQILNARVDPAVNPDATISMFDSKEEKVTVLWVDGLKSLPADYATK